jgi:RNA polymerase sigma-B factor
MSVGVSRLEIDEKFSAYRRSRERRLRDELVEAHFPLARSLASRFRNGSEPFDELVQVASIGLVKAVERYNLDYGTSFTTFATPTILGELKRHMRDRTWSLHVSRRDKDLSLEVRAAIETVQQRVHRSEPSARQIAAHAGLTEADASRGQRALALHNSISIEASTVAGEVGADDADFERAETRSVVRDLLTALPHLERDIVHAYYLEGRTQADIARQLGRSQMFVSRHLERSLEILRTQVAHKWPVGPAHAALPTTRNDARLSVSSASCSAAGVEH